MIYFAENQDKCCLFADTIYILKSICEKEKIQIYYKHKYYNDNKHPNKLMNLWNKAIKKIIRIFNLGNFNNKMKVSNFKNLNDDVRKRIIDMHGAIMKIDDNYFMSMLFI